MRVVAGVIFNQKGEVLLAERPPGKHLAGLWEFPGGKIEENETEEAALTRELQEELQLHIKIEKRLGEFPFRYDHAALTLIAFKAVALNEPTATEHVQRFRWLDLNCVAKSDMAPADIPILELLKAQVFRDSR